MLRKLFITGFFLFCLPGVLVMAQSATDAGLVLNGTAEYCGRADIQNPEMDCYHLRMVFQNKGTQPAILINPTLAYGTGLKEVVFNYSYTEYNLKTYEPVKVVSNSPYTIPVDDTKLDNFKSMALLFDDKRPTENMTIILEPGDTFTFEDKFEVKPQFRNIIGGLFTEKDKATGKSVIRPYPPNKVRPFGFELVYEFSFTPFVAEPEFLENLNKKWRRFGRLPLGTNGTYTITSVPITKINGLYPFR